ncbi:phage head completion protein [Alloyangia pacifica]|uniref:Phage head-tail joining protein n=1 Tax=Alloyangia pacifica TaxID=311180 RepID=A0A1I6QJU5_9RHOB|nr:head-tail adaptor protein [Alloyangia pacifica]SDF91379.1 Phage head-tail joining protein [Alloyangia pacifica]SFS52620.1 Phage head-tail joining protein [Alloyangia pacifica]
MIGRKEKRALSGKAGVLTERVAFDENVGVTGSLGGTVTTWTERHLCRAEWIYQRGDEAVQAARLAGRRVFKIKVRSCAATRSITTDYRMRDMRRGLPSGVGEDVLPGNRWDVKDVDAITDRQWVYLTVEGEVVS